MAYEKEILDTLNRLNNHLANITRSSGYRNYGNNQGGYYPSYSSGYYENYSQNKELRPSTDKRGFSHSDMLYKNDLKYNEKYDSNARQVSERARKASKEIYTPNTGLNSKIKATQDHIDNLNKKLSQNANLSDVERGVITQRIKTLEELKKKDEELKKANEEVIKATDNYYKNLGDAGAKMRLTTAIFKKNFEENWKKMWQQMEDSGEALLYSSEEAAKAMQEYIMNLHEQEGKYISNMQSALAQTGLTNKGPGKVLAKYMDRKQKGLNMMQAGERMQKSAEQFGNAVGSKGAAKIMKNFGAIAQKTGSMLKNLAGPITIIIEILSFIDKAAAKVMEKMTEMNEIELAEVNAQTGMAMTMNKVQVEAIQKGWDVAQKAASVGGQITLQQIETSAKIMNSAAQLVASNYAKSAEIFTGSLFDGISKTANQAARYAIEATADIAKFHLDMPLAQIKTEALNRLKSEQLKAEVQNLQDQFGLTKKQAEFEIYNQAIDFGIEKAGYGPSALFYDLFRKESTRGKIGNKFGINNWEGIPDIQAIVEKMGFEGKDIQWAKTINEGLSTIGINAQSPEAAAKLFESQLKLAKGYIGAGQQAQLGKMQIDVANAIGLRNYQMEVMRNETEIKNAKLDAVNEVKKHYIDKGKEVLLKWQQIGENFENMMQEHNKLAIDAGIDIGYTNARQNSLDFHNYYMGMQRDITWKWGKEAKDALKLQGVYTSESGRNRALSYGDTDSLMAANKLLGDEGTAVQFASSAEIFNKGIGKSVDLMSTMYNKVTRMGLNGRKYTKEILKNIQMANKYNFRDGLEGMMRTAAWAMKTRFEMSSLGRITDKIIDNGLEGVIKQSAQLQVLGGMAAINSDPLGMLYDALADPEALAKRMHGMTENFGSIDRRTGETTFGAAEELQIRAIAQAQGRDPGELRNEIRARNRAQAVKNQTRFSTNLSQEQIDFLAANAQWDEKSQGFTAQVWGKDENGNWGYQQKNVSEITAEMIDKIRPEEHQAVVEEQLFAIRSALEMETGESAQERADVATATYAKYIENVQARVTEAHNNYLAKRDEYIGNVEDSMARATESFTNYIDMWNKGNTEVDKQIKNLEAQVNGINGALDGVATEGRKAEAALRDLAQPLIDLKAIMDKFTPNIDVPMQKTSNLKDKSNEYYNKAYNAISAKRSGGAYTPASIHNVNKLLDFFKPYKDKSVDELLSDNKFINEFVDKATAGFISSDVEKMLEDKGFLFNNESLKEVLDEKGVRARAFLDMLKDIDYEKSNFSDTGEYWLGTRKVKLNATGGHRMYNGSFWGQNKNFVKNSFGNAIPVSNQDKVVKVEDAVVQTHPNDTLLAAKPGGGFDKLFSSILPDISNIGRYVASTMNGNIGGNSTFTINGSLKLTSDSGNSIDIIPMLKNNPDMLRQLVNILISGSEIYHNGGKTNEFLRI